jgi:transposase InsO family protein
MNYSLNSLYTEIGISKQAVAQYDKRQISFDDNMLNLIELGDLIRKEHPGCGVEKMYYTLKPNFIGRDRFITHFMNLGYRLKTHKNRHITTRSSSFYYPNLIKGMVINSPSTIWQTDITYFRIGDYFYYGIFIIDVYTKEIVGHKVSNHMRATANIAVLKKALNKCQRPVIHHSDRGSQYTCKAYIELLEKSGSKVSMGLCAQDNAYAERINQTIKYEYLNYWKPKSFSQLVAHVNKAVKQYNNKRIHNTFRPLKMTPVEFKNYVLNLPKQERPTETIYTEVEYKTGEVSNLSNFKQELIPNPNCPI